MYYLMEKFVKIKDSFDSVVLKRDQHKVFFLQKNIVGLVLNYPLWLTAENQVIRSDSLQRTMLSFLVHSSGLTRLSGVAHSSVPSYPLLWITAVNQVIRFGSGNHFKIE